MGTPSKPGPGNVSKRSSIGSQGNTNSPARGNTNSPARGAVDQSMSQLSLASQPVATTLAQRPGFGTTGTEVKAQVNFFSINLTSTPPIFDYDVSMTGKDREGKEKKDSSIGRNVRQRIIYLLLQKDKLKNAASDYSKRIVSADPIESQSSEGQDLRFVVDYYEAGEQGPRRGTENVQYVVVLKQTGQLDMQVLTQYLMNQGTTLPDNERYISALNILLGRACSQNINIATSGRRAKFFDVGTPANGHDLGYGLHVFKGFFRAVTPTISGLMLNVNTAAAVMIQSGSLNKVIGTMDAPYSTQSIARRIHILEGQLKHVRVQHQLFGHPTRRSLYKIARPKDPLRGPTADNVEFRRDRHPITGAEEDKEITVAKHFKEKYRKLGRTDVAAWVVNLGSDSKPNYVPSDLLMVVPGNFYKGLVPHSDQGGAMIKITCVTPSDNKSQIQDHGLGYLGIGLPEQHALNPEHRFNIKVSNKMMDITARKLPPPLINFAAGSKARPQPGINIGKWNLTNVRFRKPCPPTKISWLEFKFPKSSSASNLQAFLDGIEAGIKGCCGFITNMTTIPDYDHSRVMSGPLNKEMMNGIWDEMKKEGIKLVFVILPDNSAENYCAIKCSGDARSGMHTVCTILRNRRIKASWHEISNLMLKFNMKLGGVNLSIHTDSTSILHKLSQKSIMFVGADVGHPSSGSMKGAPSIAGVVASMDDFGFQYSGRIRRQNHKDENKKSIEYILEFKEMMVELLHLYRSGIKRRLPEVIFVYRDGVADSMFTECVNQELRQLKEACRGLYDSQKLPQIVFIVAQKRHHTRFYQPKGDNSGNFDADGNPNPGFVVDNQICDPHLWDWYMISHKCLQGTSRATHYTVLYNGTDLTINQIQSLTHNSCWLLGRTNSSISIHPAARHADLLCDRARVYYRSAYVPADSQQAYDVNSILHWSGRMHPDTKNTMFWV